MLTAGMVTDREEVPHEAGAWMRFRYLGWKQVKAARDAKTKQSLELARELGQEFLESLTARAAAQPVSTTTPAEDYDPLTDYDQATLLRVGIAEWSYGPDVLPDATDALDEATATWAARRIADLNRPATDAERRKN